MEFAKFVVSPDVTVLQAMDAINRNGRGIVYVCDAQKRLLGCVTDGDVRRHILQNLPLSAPVRDAMNSAPKSLSVDRAASAHDFMLERHITSVPLLDRHGCLAGVDFLNAQQVHKPEHLDIPVVIMAGGKGTRLYPYTKVLPKPLIPVGDKTIIELIMEKFESFGCDQFNVIVNYKRNIIKSFFMDSEQAHRVTFTDEYEFMGTGGGLKLLEGQYDGTFFMTNCDVLLEEDYGEIVRYHRAQNNILTMVCAMKNVSIPYGTVELHEDGSVARLTEKPSFSFLTNTGIYLIEPKFLEYIPKDKFIHITDVITRCIEAGEHVGAYPVGEQAWMDMGELQELEKMRKRLTDDG